MPLKKQIDCLVVAALAMHTLGVIPFGLPGATADALVFKTTAPTNDLKGTLAAQVLFAQSQIVPAHPCDGDSQPHLIGNRRCLVVVRPLQADDSVPLEVIALNKHGKQLGSIHLDVPEKLPLTAYVLDGLPEGRVDFEPAGGSVLVVSDKDELQKLNDPHATFLYERLRQHAVVEIQTADGRWVRTIKLPQGPDLGEKMVRIRSSAGYTSTIEYSNRTAVISRGEVLQFKCVQGQWVLECELENRRLAYAADAWSGVLPADWIVPGLCESPRVAIAR